MRGRARRYDERYAEDVRLSDGTLVRLRLVRPDDKPLLKQGFRDLSAASRYRRFLGAKNELDDRASNRSRSRFAVGLSVTCEAP